MRYRLRHTPHVFRILLYVRLGSQLNPAKLLGVLVGARLALRFEFASACPSGVQSVGRSILETMQTLGVRSSFALRNIVFRGIELL